MILTQEQANARAEREFPAPFRTQWNRDVYNAAIANQVVYAKCLMDMNPLIEAGENMKAAIYDSIPAYGSLYNHERDAMNAANIWDTALSNLTKK